MNDLKELLTEGELSVTGRLVDASNATLYGTVVAGDEEVRVIYKPIAGERPLWDSPTEIWPSVSMRHFFSVN